MNYEEIIEKIEDILEEGKPTLGGGGKLKIDGDAIHECLQELSSSIPTEIIQARKIVAERREILQAAQETASKIVQDAQERAAQLTEAHEITKSAKDAALKLLNDAKDEADKVIEEANAQAEERENSAKNWAYEIRTSASGFAKGILDDCQTMLESDIDHYTQSLENIRIVTARLNNVAIKKPTDE